MSSRVVLAVVVMLISATVSFPVSAQVTNGLISHLGFDNGTAGDVSGNGNGGVVVGGTPVEDRFGRSSAALRFDGTGDYVTITNQLTPDHVSVALWFRATVPGKGLLAQSRGGWEILIDEAGKITARMSRAPLDGTSLDGASALDDGAWHFVAFTYDGTTARLVVDGDIADSHAFASSAAIHDDPGGIVLGRDGNTLSDYFNGEMDEFRLYDRALSPDEVEAVFQQAEVFVTPPVQTVPVGTTVRFHASVHGSGLELLGWRIDDVYLSGETNATLTVTNASAADSGLYSFVVSNQFGVTGSQPARLVVVEGGSDLDADGLSNALEYRFGTDMENPDTDRDGLSDYDEVLVHGTNPLAMDTDGDGFPDGLELQYGLNPRIDDTDEDKDFDGLTNLEEINWNLTHTNAWEQMDLARAFSGTNAVSDYERLHGIRTSRPVYDRNDRLIGMEYSHGYSLAYVYDGNGNLTRQKWLSRASETNGLPALFSFLNGLTNNTLAHGPYGDADGDRWSNWQELQAGSNPRQPTSVPNITGDPGEVVRTLPLSASVTNHLAGIGDLDGLPGDEFAVAGMGDFSAATNDLLVFAFNGVEWEAEAVALGNWTATSLFIGSVSNRTGPGVFVGLSAPGLAPRVVEYVKTNGVWSSNLVVTAQGGDLRLLGLTDDGALLVNMTTGGISNGVHRVFAPDTNSWNSVVLSTNSASRGPMSSGTVPGRTARGGAIRRLDTGELEVVSGIREIYKDGFLLPSVVFPAEDGSKLYFVSSNSYTWNAAESFAQSHGGHLVTISNPNENQFVLDTVASGMPTSAYWIGLQYVNNIPGLPSNHFDWRWVDGSSAGYRNWGPGSQTPRDPSSNPYAVQVRRGSFSEQGMHYPAGTWDGVGKAATTHGVFQVTSPWQVYSNYWLLPPLPNIANAFAESEQLTPALWSTNANGSSAEFFHSWMEDRNQNGEIDGSDVLVLEQILLLTNSWSTVLRAETPLASESRKTPQHGLTRVKDAHGTAHHIAVAEPDGAIRIWQTNGPTPSHGVLHITDSNSSWAGLHGLRNPAGGGVLLGLESRPADAAMRVRLWEMPPSMPSNARAVSQTAPSVTLSGDFTGGGPQSTIRIRLWDNEGNPSRPYLEFQTPESGTWLNASLLSVDGQDVGPVAALPGGSNHDLVWNAGQDLGPGYSNTVQLRARASDVTLTGPYSVPMAYQVMISPGAPIAVHDSVQILEDTPVDIPVLANDSVQGGLTLSVVGVSQGLYGTNSINPDKTIRYQPATNYFGPDTFTYTISDGAGSTSEASVAVTILPVNDPPSAPSYPTFNRQEDEQLSFRWNGDRDAEGDFVGLKPVGAPYASSNGGMVTISGENITFVPRQDYWGADSFTFDVIDDGTTAGVADPRTATVTVNVNLSPVNDRPTVSAPTSLSVAEDSMLSVTNLLIDDVDAGAGSIRVGLAVTNGNLRLASTNGLTFASGADESPGMELIGQLGAIQTALSNLTYEPVPDYFGPDSLRVTVDDQGHTGAGGPQSAPVVNIPITISPVNDAPLVALSQPTNGAVFLTVDTIALEATVTGGDSPVDRVEFLHDGVGIGESRNTPYRFDWTNAPADEAAELRARVFDLAGSNRLSAPVTVEIRQPGLVLLPQIEPQMIVESSTLIVTNSATDPENLGHRLAYSLLRHPAGVTIDTNGVISWTPSEAQGPTNALIETAVHDPEIPGRGATNQFTVMVAEVNLPPLPRTIPNTNAIEGTLLEVDASTVDPDLPTNTLSYHLLTPPDGMTIDSASGLIRWVPGEEFGGGTNFVIVQVRDDGTPPGTNTYQFLVAVAERNEAPTLAPIPLQSTVELDHWTYLLSASDPDLPTNSLSFAKLAGPPAMTINTNSGLLSWTPGEADGSNEFHVTVAVYDAPGGGLSATQAFTLVVHETNSPPRLVSATNFSVMEMSELVFTNVAVDSDLPANTLEFSLSNGLPGMSIGPSDGILRWTPGEVHGPGVHETTVIVTDDGGGRLGAAQVLRIEVLESNRPPTLSPVGDRTITEHELLSLTLMATDPDIPTNRLAFAKVSGPPGLTVNSTNGLLRWTPSENDQGTHAVTVRVSDDFDPAGTAERSFMITVNESNSPPVFDEVPAQVVRETTLLTFQLTARDSDRPTNSLTFEKLSGPTGVTVGANGVFAWTPTAAQGPSNYFVSVRVTDDGMPMLSDELTFAVTVSEDNTSPVVAPIADTNVAEGMTFAMVVSATDPDDLYNQLSYTLVSSPTNMTIDAAGLIEWVTGEQDGPSTNAVTVQVKDNATPPAMAQRSFVVIVDEVNLPPIPRVIPNTNTVENALFAYDASTTDPDIPTNSLQYALRQKPEGMTIDLASGLIQWTPDENSGGTTQTVIVEVRDDGKPPATNSYSFNIAVAEDHRAPALAPIPLQSIVELEPWSYQLSASDPDVPANLNFAKLAGPPAMTIDKNTGLLSWTPGEPDGSNEFQVTVAVYDAPAGGLSATQSFVMIVHETNSPPRLVSATNLTVAELTPLVFTNLAVDSDLPANILEFSLGMTAPTNAVIDPLTGVLTWTPTESQGSNAAVSFAVIVTDNGQPVGIASNTLSIFVEEVNTAPTMGSISNRMHRAHRLLSIPTSASDVDLPPNELTYEVLSSLTGLTINPTNGLLTWTPTTNQIGTNAVSLRVYDDGSPALAATQTFQVIVSGGLAPILRIRIEDGTPVLGLTAEPGETYRINITTNVNGSNWIAFPTVISGQSGEVELRDTNAAGSTRRFYRAVVE